jgi:beta-glucosidase
VHRHVSLDAEVHAAGKLPFTLPRHVGQMPLHYGQKRGSGYRRTKEDIHHGYLDVPSTQLFPFGHGLSYTTFEYGPLKLDSDTVDVSWSWSPGQSR